MSDIVNWMQQLPEPDRLALSTRYALLKAQLDATRMRAEEIQPEHLLLGLIKQNDARIMQMCASLEMDLVPIYKHFILAQPAAQQWTQSFYKESRGFNLSWHRSYPSSEALLTYFTGGITLGAKSASFKSGECPSCKQSTLPSWKHCVYCGVSLARVCPHCGAPYPEIEGAQFCFECGGKLEA